MWQAARPSALHEPRGSAPDTNSSATAGGPPHPAAPRLTLDGEGGTNQRATSPFRFQAPRHAAHTPGSPFADWLRVPPVGPEAGGGGPRLPAPRSAPGPARGARPPSVPAVLPPSSVRVPLGRRASRLTGGRGRQSAGGRVPARGCAGESAGPAARGGRRGYRARRRRSSSPACSSRALCEPPEGRCSAAAAGAEGGGAGCGQGRGAGTRRAELAAPSLPPRPSAGRGERGPGGGAGAPRRSSACARPLLRRRGARRKRKEQKVRGSARTGRDLALGAGKAGAPGLPGRGVRGRVTWPPVWGVAGRGARAGVGAVGRAASPRPAQAACGPLQSRRAAALAVCVAEGPGSRLRGVWYFSSLPLFSFISPQSSFL